MSWVYSRLPFARTPGVLPGFQEACWRSQALRKRMAFGLYLPPGYHGQRPRRHPVRYLLHGSGHGRHSVLSDPWQGLLDFCTDELIIHQRDFAHVHLASGPIEAVRALASSVRAANP